jgi:hypothetical protein
VGNANGLRAEQEAVRLQVGCGGCAHRRLIADFALRNRLSSVHNFRDSVEVGGLIPTGVDPLDVYRRAADYVDRLLRGARPPISTWSDPRSSSSVITDQAIGRMVSESPGRKESERRGGPKRLQPRRPSLMVERRRQHGLSQLADAAGHSGGVRATVR